MYGMYVMVYIDRVLAAWLVVVDIFHERSLNNIYF